MMKETNKLFRILFYVFLCFVVLYSSSIQAQNNTINNFFRKEKLHAYNYCRNELKTDEDYLSVKKKKDTMLINLLENNCNLIIKNYNTYNDYTLRLIDDNSGNNADFIIINMDVRSSYRPNPVLTLMKFKNNDKYYALHYDYEFDEVTKRSYRVTNSLIATDNVEKKFNLLENYFYNKKLSDKIFTDSKTALKKHNFQSINTFFVVARVSGKIITKKIYFADDNNY